MVISGGNYKGKDNNSGNAPKTSEVVSLLLGDDDLEKRFREQKANIKKQEKENKALAKKRMRDKVRICFWFCMFVCLFVCLFCLYVCMYVCMFVVVVR